MVKASQFGDFLHDKAHRLPRVHVLKQCWAVNMEARATALLGHVLLFSTKFSTPFVTVLS